jgi:methylenetetrahydrofolate reductase (NADPH)
VNFFDRVFKKDNDRKKMNFSIEIGPHSDIETLPALSDVYVTMLPGGDYKETADKALELVKKGFNPSSTLPCKINE